jgi:hypothetical protein
MIDPKGLLMIEPRHGCDPETLVDGYVMKMAGALKHARRGPAWKGIHMCRCGAGSGNCDLIVRLDGKDIVTNSLAVHYLACHRGEVPVTELEKVDRLEYAMEVPGPKLIARPQKGQG